MGNTFAGANCCAPDMRKSGEYDGKDGAGFRRPGAKTPSASEILAGHTIDVAYCEWEEIIALSRAITPGGKLLGLSSTKKMICTLHRSSESAAAAAAAAAVTPDVSGGSTTAGLPLEDDEDADHFIKLWEVNRVVVKPFLASRNNGESAPRKDEDGDGAGGRNEDASSSSGGADAGENVGKPKISEIASLLLPVGVKVHKIAFLDSANPQFVVGSVEIEEDSAAHRHELWVWILQPARRGFQHVVKDVMRQQRQQRDGSGVVAGTASTLGDGGDPGIPRSKSAVDFTEIGKLQSRAHAGGLGLDSSGRGGGGINSNNKQHKIYLHRVCVLPLSVGAEQIPPSITPQPAAGASTLPAAMAAGTTSVPPSEAHNASSSPSSSSSSPPSSRITAIATLRDYLLAGDHNGRIHGWLWTNWYQADWRRVNRRRRRASQATEREPLTPAMRPLNICFAVDANAAAAAAATAAAVDPASVVRTATGSGRFATANAGSSATTSWAHHPGGVTCLHISHARSGMELYSAGRDDSVRIWSIDDVRDVVLMHTIDLQLYGMRNPCCLNVSQTPDVGAAWYAASHGFHAGPTSAPAEFVSNPVEAKRLKRTRGSRNTLPPKMFIAGERFEVAARTSNLSRADENGENVEDGDQDGNGAGSTRSGGGRVAYRDRYMVQGFLFASVRGDGKNRMEKACACYLGHSAPISTLSYGPYNNGPLMSMCVGGQIKIWPTMMGEGAVQHGGGTRGGRPTATVEYATATYSSWTEDNNSIEVKGRGKLPIFASAVQPNDHVWAVGTEHIRAWALV
jgi:hypothetical protein